METSAAIPTIVFTSADKGEGISKTSGKGIEQTRMEEARTVLALSKKWGPVPDGSESGDTSLAGFAGERRPHRPVA